MRVYLVRGQQQGLRTPRHLGLAHQPAELHGAAAAGAQVIAQRGSLTNRLQACKLDAVRQLAGFRRLLDGMFPLFDLLNTEAVRRESGASEHAERFMCVFLMSDSQ